jgi:hypothetical protein
MDFESELDLADAYAELAATVKSLQVRVAALEKIVRDNDLDFDWAENDD